MKKSLFVITIILLTISFKSFGQIIERFSDYDYEEEITIAGSRGEKNIYIPVKENIDILNTYINLEFVCSNVIDFSKSHISILIADVPVETQFIKTRNQRVKFQLLVKKKYIVSDFIKLTIRTNLRIGKEICDLYSQGGYWVKLTEDSFFYYKELSLEDRLVKKTINYIIPDIEYIVLSDENNLKDIEYASYIKFYLKRVYGLDIEIKTTVDYEDKVIKNAIILMPYQKLEDNITTTLPAFKNDENGLIATYNDRFKDKKTKKVYNGSNIVVTGKNELGYNKAANFLLQKHLINSSYVDYVFVKTKSKLFDTPKRKDYEPIYFKELGAENSLLQGIGYLQSNVSMPRTNFGSNVKQMQVKISGKYRPLQEEEQGFFNLYFNDNFITSYKLDNSGELNLDFNFDNIILEQDNNFMYEFYFVPKGGLCQVTAAKFYGQINIVDSYFKPIGYDASSSLSFFKFPENFQSDPITIYTDLEANTKLIDGISEIVDIINPGETGLSGFIYPQIKTADLTTISTDVNTSKIIISANKSKFSNFYGTSPFINFKDDTVEFRAEEIDPFYNLEYQKNMGFNQLFYHQASPVMLVTLPENYSKNTLISLFSNIREQTISETGNVIVSNNDNAYFFDLRKVNNTESKSSVSNFLDDFWVKYRLFIILILLILIILILVFIYQKSKESKSRIKDAK